MKSFSFSMILLVAVFGSQAFGAEKSMVLTFSDSGQTGEVIVVLKNRDDRSFFSCNTHTNRSLDLTKCSVLPKIDVDEVESAVLAGSTTIKRPLMGAGAATLTGGIAYISTSLFYTLKYGLALHTYQGGIPTGPTQAQLLRHIKVRTIAIVVITGAIGYKLADIGVGQELTEFETAAIQLTIGDEDVISRRNDTPKQFPVTAEEYKNSLQVAANSMKSRQ